MIRFIAGEAKWRKKLQLAVVAELMYGKKKKNPDTNELEHDGKGIWYQVNQLPIQAIRLKWMRPARVP